MTTARVGLPYFYATGIAKALVGDQPCLLQPWLNGHFVLDKPPRTGNFAKWKTDHTAQLQAEVDRLRRSGWTCKVEQFFRLTGQAAILGGKPDIIAQAEGQRPRIVDIKSGTPHDSDTAQVCIYQLAIPLAWKSPTMQFAGEVIYPDHRVPLTPTVAEQFREKLFALLRRLAGDVRPEATPSEGACRFCDVPDSECEARWKEGTSVEALTAEF